MSTKDKEVVYFFFIIQCSVSLICLDIFIIIYLVAMFSKSLTLNISVKKLYLTIKCTTLSSVAFILYFRQITKDLLCFLSKSLLKRDEIQTIKQNLCMRYVIKNYLDTQLSILLMCIGATGYNFRGGGTNIQLFKKFQQ